MISCRNRLAAVPCAARRTVAFGQQASLFVPRQPSSSCAQPQPPTTTSFPHSPAQSGSSSTISVHVLNRRLLGRKAGAGLLSVCSAQQSTELCLTVGLGGRRHISTAQHLEKLGLKVSDLGSLPDIPSPTAPGALLERALDLPSHGNIYEVGLGAWYTSCGWYQRLLDFMVNTCDLPWWSSIVLVTVAMRLMLLPVTVSMQRHAARAHNAHPGFVRISNRLSQSQASGDKMLQMEAYMDMQDYTKKHDISPTKRLPGIVTQFFVFLTVFYGLRKMVRYNVDGLSYGGMLWFPDLTVADALYTVSFYGAHLNLPGALPFVAAITVAAVSRLGVESGMAVEAMSPMMRRGMLYVMPGFVLMFTAQHPSALALYWCTSNSCSLAFAGLFKLETFRDLLKIPRRIEHPPEAMKMPARKGFFAQQKVRTMEELQRSHEDKLAAQADNVEPVASKYVIKSPRAKRTKRTY